MLSQSGLLSALRDIATFSIDSEIEKEIHSVSSETTTMAIDFEAESFR